MFAVIRTGGKQYRVAEGESIDVELLPAQEGSKIEFDDVLLVAHGGSAHVGTPTVAGAKVVGTVLKHGKGPKLIVFKYRKRKNYRRKNGHRQPFTRIHIDTISTSGATRSVPPPPPRG